jgi:hypothetical protein
MADAACIVREPAPMSKSGASQWHTDFAVRREVAEPGEARLGQR